MYTYVHVQMFITVLTVFPLDPPNHIVSLNATAYVGEITADTPFGIPVLYFSAAIGNPDFNRVFLSLSENDLVERVFKFPNGQTSQTFALIPDAGNNTSCPQAFLLDIYLNPSCTTLLAPCFVRILQRTSKSDMVPYNYAISYKCKERSTSNKVITLLLRLYGYIIKFLE